MTQTTLVLPSFLSASNLEEHDTVLQYRQGLDLQYLNQTSGEKAPSRSSSVSTVTIHGVEHWLLTYVCTYVHTYAP